MPHEPLPSLEAAWDALCAALPEARRARVARREALGRTLAEPVRAVSDSPVWDVSAMDGYALAGDVDPGTVLEISATIAAGGRPDGVLAPGSAVKIMTGAPLPRGADRVVPVEATDGGRERVRIDEPPKPGAHIRRAAEVFRRDDEILPAGALLTPAALALLASQGLEEIAVAARPRIAFLTTGDEVVAAASTPQPGQLRNSHADFLSASCRRLGIEAADLGIVPDRREEVEARIRAGLDYDLLLITGGVSMGDFDFVPSALESLGCTTLFHGLAIRPGKPLLAARHSSGLVLGLPGNPGSVIVAFELFANPLIRRWQGVAATPWADAQRRRIRQPLRANPANLDRFLPCRLGNENGTPVADLLSPRGSHDLAAFAGATGLVRLRPSDAACEAGAECEVLPLLRA